MLSKHLSDFEAKSVHDSRTWFPQCGLWTMTTTSNRPQELVTSVVPTPTLLYQSSHFPERFQATTVCRALIGTHCATKSLEPGLAIMPSTVVTRALEHDYRPNNFTSGCPYVTLSETDILQSWTAPGCSCRAGSALVFEDWGGYHLKPKQFASSHQMSSKPSNCQQSTCFKGIINFSVLKQGVIKFPT